MPDDAPELTHFDAAGRAKMVDVSAKAETERVAVARGAIVVGPVAMEKILFGTAAKGDVLGVAQVAAIMGAKRTAELIPLCHPLALTGVEVALRPDAAAGRVEIEARVKTTGRTGAEMEALTAVSVAALTVYDMVKAVDRTMTITDIRLVEKSGGKSGPFRRPGEES